MAKPVTMPQLGESVTGGHDNPLAESRRRRGRDRRAPRRSRHGQGKRRAALALRGQDREVPRLGGHDGRRGNRDRAGRRRGDSPATDAPRRRTSPTPPPQKSFPPLIPRPSPWRRRVRRRPPAKRGNGRGEVKDAETLRLTRSSPVVRRLAEEHNVKIADVPSPGTGGRVTRKDIEGYIEEGGAEREAATEQPAPQRVAAPSPRNPSRNGFPSTRVTASRPRASGGPSRTAWPPANARPRTHGRWSRWI